MPKSPIKPRDAFKRAFDTLHTEFQTAIKMQWSVPADIEESLRALYGARQTSVNADQTKRRDLLGSVIAKKFDVNHKMVQEFFNFCASHGRALGPLEKREVDDLFNTGTETEFVQWCQKQQINFDRGNHHFFKPLRGNELAAFFDQELHSTTVKRRDARSDVQDERREAILRSVFGTWAVHCLGLGIPLLPFRPLADHPDLGSAGAVHICIDKLFVSKCQQTGLINGLRAVVENAYRELRNHRFLSITVVHDPKELPLNRLWEIAFEMTVFAERFQNVSLISGYFKPDQIAAATLAHNAGIKREDAKFEVFCSGFIFKDCFVFSNPVPRNDGETGELKAITLLLEKNVADERLIPCPMCGSTDIRGNSYPSIGVRSWECQNPICVGRSALDRGFRFTPAALERAAALWNPRAVISPESIRRFKLDVVGQTEFADIFKVLVTHYSQPGDLVLTLNWRAPSGSSFGRKIETMADPNVAEACALYSNWDSPFFHRYQPTLNSRKKAGQFEPFYADDGATIYQGKCEDVLKGVATASVDGAVTSPPYFNAREYATWPNIYCYFHDMFTAAHEVFRVLKPGGYYLFNIFDYFDNENIVALSAMGKRRLPLGAYLADIFRRVGFEMCGNVVWSKGEIEGKRNYNQGYHVPFYQMPLNTWEHILVLRKPSVNSALLEFPPVIRLRPVIKWVGGENRHGHSAPFPQSIPDLLCSRLPSGSVILDPYAGSFTTWLSAKKYSHQFLGAEIHEEYIRLGLSRLNELQPEVLNDQMQLPEL